MTLTDILKQLNKKKQIKIDRLLYCKKHYLSLYRGYLVKLYDYGFISDPTKFNEKEILSNIVDLSISGLVDVRGRVILTSKQTSYALHRNSEEEESFLFLQLLSQALKYKEYSDSLDCLYDTLFDGMKNTKVSFSLKYKAGAVVSRSPVKFNKGVFECFVTMDSDVVEYSVNETIWKVAMKYLGVPEKDWYKDGVLDRKLTHEEEVMFADILLEGVVELDGIYADKLSGWLSDHKWSDQKLSIYSHGLYTYLFVSDVAYEISNVLKEKMQEIEDSGESVLYFNYGYIYATKPREYMKIPISQFVVTYDEDKEELGHLRNSIEEYTGEAYCKQYLDKHGIQYVGCPIVLYVGDKVIDYFIDVEQTEIKDYRSWFDVVGANLYYNEGELLKVDDKYPLDVRLNCLLENSEKGEAIGCLRYNFNEEELSAAKRGLYKSILRSKKDES